MSLHSIRTGNRFLVMIILLLVAGSAGVASSRVLIIRLNRDQTISWVAGSHPNVLVLPRRGDGWYALAKRYCANPETIAPLRAANPRLRAPLKDVPVRVPVTALKGRLRLEVVRRLFPVDRRVRDGWRHQVLDPFGPRSETWGWLAELFAGSPRQGRMLRRANPDLPRSGPRRGQLVLIPEAHLLEIFKSQPVWREQQPTRPSKPRPPSRARRPTQPPAVPTRMPAVPVAQRANDVHRVSLTYGRDRHGAYAIYRLKAGEALYSAVVVRLTGQLHAAEVIATAFQIARRSGIRDVTSIPAGYPVKIPLDLLLPEYLPAANPRRIAWEARRRGLEKYVRPVHARRLEGVWIILDAGHGGCDTGAVVDGVWESTYAYDLLCRIKADLERQTQATVWTTIEDRSRGYRIPHRDVLREDRDQFLLTHPPFLLGNSTTGVHLRWYLTNSIVWQARRQGVPPGKTVFISIHADSLYRGVRGSMVYVPSRYLRPASFGVNRPVMRRFREVREHPRVVLSSSFKARAEASSRRLARQVIRALQASGLAVHPYEPVRGSVLRGRRRWVPAVLRYSLAQNAILIECANLANERDRKNILSRTWRRRFAESVVTGLIDAFGGR